MTDTNRHNAETPVGFELFPAAEFLIGPVIADLPDAAQRLMASSALTAAEAAALAHMQDAGGIFDVAVSGDGVTVGASHAYRAWLDGVQARIEGEIHG